MCADHTARDARASTQLRERLTFLRAEIRRTQAALKEAELREAITRQASDAYDRMKSGQYPVRGCSGLWWCDNGNLLERLSPEEVQGLLELKRRGIVQEETRRAA